MRIKFCPLSIARYSRFFDTASVQCTYSPSLIFQSLAIPAESTQEGENKTHPIPHDIQRARLSVLIGPVSQQRPSLSPLLSPHSSFAAQIQADPSQFPGGFLVAAYTSLFPAFPRVGQRGSCAPSRANWLGTWRETESGSRFCGGDPAYRIRCARRDTAYLTTPAPIANPRNGL